MYFFNRSSEAVRFSFTIVLSIFKLSVVVVEGQAGESEEGHHGGRGLAAGFAEIEEPPNTAIPLRGNLRMDVVTPGND